MEVNLIVQLSTGPLAKCALCFKIKEMDNFSSTVCSMCELFTKVHNWGRFSFTENSFAYFLDDYSFHCARSKFLKD